MSKLIVNHQHRYTLEKSKIYEGKAKIERYDDCAIIKYQESTDVEVCITAYDNEIRIVRKSDELTSDLRFIEDSDTTNTLKTDYGDLELIMHTFEYKFNDSEIILEYDVLSTDEPDGFRIIFKIEEELNEFN